MKKIIGISVFIIVLFFSFSSLMFLKGEVIRPSSIGLLTTNFSTDHVSIKGSFVLESAKAYKNHSVRIENDNVYITIYGVLVSPLYNDGTFDININGHFENIKNIYLEGNNETLLIWESKS